MFFVTGTLHVSGGVYGGSSGGGGYNALPESGTQSPTNNNGILGGPDTSSNGGMSPSRYDPYFDALTPRNVTALVGKSAYLSCRVRNLGNKTVSLLSLVSTHIYIYKYKTLYTLLCVYVYVCIFKHSLDGSM